jgi:hypothetical protein
VIVVRLVDARRARDPHAIDEDRASCAEVVDVRREPASVIAIKRGEAVSWRRKGCLLVRKVHLQLPHVVTRLVVPSDDDGEDRSRLLSRVVRMKRAKRSELLRNGERLEVVRVSKSLTR